MKYIKILISVFLISLLCSCGGTEPNNIAYTVAIGFDKSDVNDNYNITIQYAKVTQISGGASEEGGKGGSEIIQNITVEAPNLYSAINTANHIVSKKFSLAHTKLIVFSQELAKDGLGTIVNSIIRNNDVFPDVYAAVSSSTAREYLEEVKPSVEVNPAKYYQLVYGTNDSGGVPKTNLQMFYFDTETKYKNAVLPLAGVTKAEDEEDNTSHQNASINQNGFDYDMKNYVAGEVAINGEHKSEAMGMVIFYGDKSVGVLGAIDSEMYNLMSGSLKQSYINFKSNSGQQAIVVKLNQHRQPQYKVDLKNKEIKINLYIESDLLDKPVESYDVSALEDEIQNDINLSCTDLLNRLKNDYNCDILGFHSKLRKEFWNLDSFNNYKFDLKDFNFTVNAEFYIRRNGMKLK